MGLEKERNRTTVSAGNLDFILRLEQNRSVAASCKAEGSSCGFQNRISAMLAEATDVEGVTESAVIGRWKRVGWDWAVLEEGGSLSHCCREAQRSRWLEVDDLEVNSLPNAWARCPCILMLPSYHRGVVAVARRQIVKVQPISAVRRYCERGRSTK